MVVFLPMPVYKMERQIGNVMARPRKPKLKKLAVLDFNNLLYKACAVNPNLSYRSKYTGGLYGFITQMCSTINETNADMVIVTDDSPPYKRKERYPDYKIKSGKPDVEFFKKMNSSKKLLLEFFYKLEIPYWSVKGLEADDLMAYISKLKKYSIILCSGDDDLYQLLRPGVKLYRGKKNGFYTLADFELDYPLIDLTDWVAILSIVGTHNGLPGVRNVGIKTVMKMVKKGELKELFRKYHSEIMLFMSLIQLPYKDGMKHEMPELKEINYNEDNVTRFLGRYGIQQTFPIRNALKLIGGW